jgi:hypothetical protein
MNVLLIPDWFKQHFPLLHHRPKPRQPSAALGQPLRSESAGGLAQSKCPHVDPGIAKACCLSVLFLLGATPSCQVNAARISEPRTMLYGRIAEQVGSHEFLFTSGRLVWNLRTTGPGGRDYQLAAQLERLADGRFSYRLSIPHQVLAYDLTVNSNAMGLTGAGSRVQHVSVTLDGNPLTINPAAVGGLTLNQPGRASALRIDLYLGTNSLDSDGDGLPDWWEDQNGFDKFDPTDAANLAASQTQNPDLSRSSVAAGARNFGEWRAAWFPNNTADLDAFGQEDPDEDGIPNLLEYAFDLDPTQVDVSRAGALPRGFTASGWAGVSFRPRPGASDLVYQVEVSDDLFHWRDGAQDVAPVTLAPGDAGQTAYATRFTPDSPKHQFFRVRVQRR